MAARPGPLRIMAGHLDGVAAQARQAADLGFSHLLLPPPWLPASPLDCFLTRDFTSLSLATGLRDLSALVGAAAGVGVLLDVVVDVVSVHAALAGTPFEAPDPAGLLDPRRRLRGDAAQARVDGPDALGALASWWAQHLRQWHKAGVAGFRLLGLGGLPQYGVAGFFTALRQAVPEAVLLPWTPGLPRDAALSLRGHAADGVFASLPWWDGKASWLWDEARALTEVAPMLGLDGVPAMPGHAAVAGHGAPGLAATLGQGWLHVPSVHDDQVELRMLNAAVAASGALAARVPARCPLGQAGPLIGLLRCDAPTLRAASVAVLAAANLDPVVTLSVSGAALLQAAGGAFEAFTDPGGNALDAASVISVPPGRTRLFAARALAARAPDSSPADELAAKAAAAPRLAIENPQPCVDGGRFPVKATAGALVTVTADVLFDGHDKVAAALQWTTPAGATHETPMRPLGNDVWAADLPLSGMGRHRLRRGRLEGSLGHVP